MRALPGIDRRGLLLGGCALLATATLPRAGRAAVPDDIRFDVHVAGSKVGHHHLNFTPGPEAGQMTVRVDVRIRVRLFFVTVFDYTQTTEEVWQDDRLVSFTSSTLDGDNRDEVTAVQGPAGLEVTSLRFGDRTLPADTWPSTAFWRQDAIERTEFLDAARGDIRTVAVTEMDTEFIDALERRHLARRFHVDTSRDFDVWYAPDGTWLKLQWSGYGMTADYRR